MHLWISRLVSINTVGNGITVPCKGFSLIRGQAEIQTGTVGACVLKLSFSVRPGGNGTSDNANDLTLATSGMHATAIDCRAHAQASLSVKTASGSADDYAILTLGLFVEHDQIKSFGRLLETNETGGDIFTMVFGDDGSGDGGSGGVSGAPPDGGGPP